MRTSFVQSIILFGLSGLLFSCAATSSFTPGKGSKYQYAYKMTYPAERADLYYQDDSIIVQFKFDEAAIRFQLQNISESYLTIRWENASISIQGRHFPIRNSANLYGDTILSSSPVLPPLGYIRDIVIPRDNVYFNGKRWVEIDLLPTTDNKLPQMEESILRSAGRQIGLVLPLTFGTGEKNYEFDFQVDSVKKIRWADYEPFQRIPEPPHPPRGVLGLDNVTTAIIAVGILGFSAYVLSIKKNPPVIE